MGFERRIAGNRDRGFWTYPISALLRARSSRSAVAALGFGLIFVGLSVPSVESQTANCVNTATNATGRATMGHRTLTRSAHLGFLGAVVLAVILPERAHAQNLPALAREQARRNPGATIEQPSPPHHYTSKTLEDLSSESDVVVQGKLIRVRSYLGAAEDRILTDFRLVEPRVIAGRFASSQSEGPGPGTPIIISVWGGELIIEGVTVRSSDINVDPIVEGQDYLLFLRQDRAKTPGRYEIYYGGIFEASATRANPLLKKGDEVFPELRSATLQDVLARVQGAKRRPSQR